MNAPSRRLLLSFLILWPAASATAAAPPRVTKTPETPAPAPSASADALAGLAFRSIGPGIMGGRIDDFAVVESRPSTFYVATAAGGLWKTVNNGITLEPVFDDQEVSSIGDVAVAPSDPSIVYVGTGEPNNRQSSSWGNGVYKSLDAGKTWISLGLADTHHIGRVVVHPTSPDVVYVAALGHLWGPNNERGLFRTTDGGKTWVNTKFIDVDTGFVDVAMDPESPQTLYAASYQRRRTPFGYNGGGPGSALWKTTNGGETWTKLTDGLPAEGDVGRIGIDVYRRDPRIVYALVEHAKEGGIYRSEDKGATWKKMSDTNPRPSYYSQVRVDPSNDQRVWVLGAPLLLSEDGGRTFRQDVGQKIHGDYHALWIDPADPSHLLAGTDGGVHITYDRARTWEYVNTVPLAQLYEISFDMQRPYHVCGGLQDNGSWCGPSRTLYQQGISNEDWSRVGGGDGFYNVIDPADPDVVYTESQDGSVSRFDGRTNERRSIRPEPPEGERYRFNWNSPIVVSRYDSDTVYYGGNRFFASRDRGESWAVVSPDLTGNAERDKMTIFGKAARDMLSRNDGVVHFGTITTMAESPVKAGVVWIGTDDGSVQVSRDGGATWARAKLPAGVPAGTYVSRVEPSRSGEGAAYVAFDGHRADDYAPYVFRTDDFGQTWRALAGNLPRGQAIHVVREHPRSPSLLFVGTEFGLYVSWNAGGSWTRVRGKLPTVPIFDVQIHPRDNDLILATHGRGVYILDDLGALAQADPATLDTDLRVFDVEPATAYRLYGHKGNTGHKFMAGPNPPEGATITYFLKAKAGEKEDVKIAITDASGAVVREIKGPKEKGLNQASWDLRLEPPTAPRPASEGESFFGPPRGPLVSPGTYTAKVTVGGASATRPIVVEEDPRIKIGTSERKEWEQAARQGARLWSRADAANRSVTALKKQLADVQDSQKSGPDDVKAALKTLADTVDGLARQLNRQEPLGFAGAPLAEEPDPLLPRARGLYLAVSGITAAPTAQQRESLARVEKQVDAAVAAVNAVIEKSVPEMNRMLAERGVGRIDGGKRIP
ncbi:MAG: hypothetical protein DMF77_09360 [Acidobacteria bacterium]|nr:MAG: hypothetical protein DMF77_09360 [Acidobacteriota bacterium]